MERTERRVSEKDPVTDYTREIIRYYVMFNKGKAESEICHNIWQYFCRTNSENIWASENEEKIASFDRLTKERQEQSDDYALYQLFYDILLVETGLKKGSREYKQCMTALYKEMKRNKITTKVPLKAVLYPEKTEKLRQKEELRQRKKEAKKIGKKSRGKKTNNQDLSQKTDGPERNG